MLHNSASSSMSSSDNFPDTGDVPGVAIPRPLGELPSCTQVYARAQALNATSVAEKPERSGMIDFYLFDFDSGGGRSGRAYTRAEFLII
jgi:hypothetical protein